MRQRHAFMASQNTRMAVGLVGLIVAGCSLPLLLSQLSKVGIFNHSSSLNMKECSG